MSTNRSRRIDRDTAEHLLAGAAAGTPGGQASLTGEDGDSGHRTLAALLTAAAAPPAEGELSGEAAALAAFRLAARPAAVPVPVHAPAAPPRRRSMAPAALAQAFSAKAAVVALAASALGGVAVAAGGGHLPAALGGGQGGSGRPAALSTAEMSTGTPPGTPSAKQTGARPGSSPGGAFLPSGGPATDGGATAPGAAASSGPADAPGTASATQPGAGPGERGASPTPGSPTAVPELVALCRDLADAEVHGKTLRSLAADARYGPLLKAAGGAEKIQGYCAAVRAGTTGSAREGGGQVTTGVSPTAANGTQGGQTGAPQSSETAAGRAEEPPARSGNTSTAR
ncbi:hypothetical protein [Kitasatospora herbaricolor]|uniref:hypothetical protein n=1 Tax=Kitasatospora herbaricolor TaxID=68217 RepID=UPI0036D78746